jgi:hypothetical protein
MSRSSSSTRFTRRSLISALLSVVVEKALSRSRRLCPLTMISGASTGGAGSTALMDPRRLCAAAGMAASKAAPSPARRACFATGLDSIDRKTFVKAPRRPD